MIGKTQIFNLNAPFTTESGQTLPHVQVTYKTWGTLNDDASNAVLICHALTGNADADEWFPGLFSDPEVLNPETQFIICSNVLGGCYGTTGPTTMNPATGRPWQGDFPEVTIRDMVRVQQHLLDALGVTSIELAVGGSMGGMQVLEWLIMDNRVQKAMLIAMGKCHSPWTIGFSEAQRRAIKADRNWKNGFYPPEAPPSDGLAAARMMGMMMYRSAEAFERRFARNEQEGNPGLLQVNSYLNYQGDKLVRRFDANTYMRLTVAMDSHDVSRERGTFGEVLGNIQVPVLVLGISSDVLYPVHEQKDLASLLPNATYAELDSDEGHDAFLIEFPKMIHQFKKFNWRLNARSQSII
jgi:homoserine O-acetyltransferase